METETTIEPGEAVEMPHAEPPDDLDRLRRRVERLEQQLALATKTFSARLTDHARRLDRLAPPGPGSHDEPRAHEAPAMVGDDGAAEPGPPSILFAIVEAAQALPPAARRGPFRGVGGTDEHGHDGLTLTVGGVDLFLSDDEAGELIAGDYVEVGPTGAGDGAIRILQRGVDAYDDAQAAGGGGTRTPNFAGLHEALDRRIDRTVGRALAPLLARIEELERRAGVARDDEGRPTNAAPDGPGPAGPPADHTTSARMAAGSGMAPQEGSAGERRR